VSRRADRACGFRFELVGFDGSFVDLKFADTRDRFASQQQSRLAAQALWHTRSRRSVAAARSPFAFSVASRTAGGAARAVDVFLHGSENARRQWACGSEHQ